MLPPPAGARQASCSGVGHGKNLARIAGVAQFGQTPRRNWGVSAAFVNGATHTAHPQRTAALALAWRNPRRPGLLRLPRDDILVLLIYLYPPQVLDGFAAAIHIIHPQRHQLGPFHRIGEPQVLEGIGAKVSRLDGANPPDPLDLQRGA